MRSTAAKTIYISLAIGLMTMVIGTGQVQAQDNRSQTIQVIDGVTYIIHKIQPKETYYQLSRTYGAAVGDIMSANNKKDLRVGDTVRVPVPEPRREEAPSNNPAPAVQETPAAPVIADTDILTEYKVGTNETLYSIAKRFQVTVADIKTLNKLQSDLVREGQLIKIPDGELPKPEPVQPVAAPHVAEVETSDPVPTKNINTSRLGLRETSEKGVGVWMTNLETKNNSNLALHKTAPVGTVLKITNPITKSVTYAKVVGKFADNSETQNAIVVLSRSAAAYIGAVDKRFVVEIAYGVPLEQ